MPAKRKSKPRSPDHAALGQAIESRIEEVADMTQDTVATKGELKLRQVNSFVRGQGNPTYTTLLKLCNGLDLRIGELMTLTDDLRDELGRE
jgi:transcriptional regulator with XRE-family HTH domain